MPAKTAIRPATRLSLTGSPTIRLDPAGVAPAARPVADGAGGARRHLVAPSWVSRGRARGPKPRHGHAARGGARHSVAPAEHAAARGGLCAGVAREPVRRARARAGARCHRLLSDLGGSVVVASGAFVADEFTGSAWVAVPP